MTRNIGLEGNRGHIFFTLIWEEAHYDFFYYKKQNKDKIFAIKVFKILAYDLFHERKCLRRKVVYPGSVWGLVLFCYAAQDKDK